MRSLGKHRWRLLVALLIVIVGYLAVAFLMVRGATNSERRPLTDHPSNHALSFEDVTFEARGGGPALRGWLLPGDAASPHVIIVHGLDGQRTDSDALDVAAGLVESGYNVLLFDLRGHGESDGERVSGGYFERDDVLGAYDFLQARGAERIGLLGYSMGAGIAVMTAALEPGIQAVVADSPFASVNDLIAQETARRTPMPEAVVPVFLPGARLIARVFYDIDLGELRPEGAVRDIAYPILVIHGEADDRIPASHGRRVYAAAQPGSELWSLSDVGHVASWQAAPDEYMRRVVDYLDARLR